MAVLAPLVEGTAEPDMPTYEFGCNNCGEVFDHIYQSVPKKMPKTRKCVTCGKKASRLISLPSVKIAGKVAKIGKSNVTQFYNEAIQDSRERLKVENAPSPYKRYVPDLKKLTDDGTLRKLSDTELRQRANTDARVGEKINNTKQKITKKK